MDRMEFGKNEFHNRMIIILSKSINTECDGLPFRSFVRSFVRLFVFESVYWFRNIVQICIRITVDSQQLYFLSAEDLGYGKRRIDFVRGGELMFDACVWIIYVSTWKWESSKKCQALFDG